MIGHRTHGRARKRVGVLVSTVVLAGAFAQSAQAAQTVALWHMDEPSGTQMIDSARGHTGTLHSVTLGLPGFSGKSYGFGRGYVSVPNASDLNPGAANINVTIHIKTTSRPATPDWDLIRKVLYTSPGGEFKMEYQPTGQASCGFKGSLRYFEMTAGPVISNGQWHTVSCVKTASAVQVVVDGQVFSKSVVLGSISPSDNIAIGARPGSEFFQGQLDEASIAIG